MDDKEKAKWIIVGILAVAGYEDGDGWSINELAGLLNRFGITKATIKAAVDDLAQEKLVTVKYRLL